MLKRAHTQQIAFTTADNALAVRMSVLATLKIVQPRITYLRCWLETKSLGDDIVVFFFRYRVVFKSSNGMMDVQPSCSQWQLV